MANGVIDEKANRITSSKSFKQKRGQNKRAEATTEETSDGEIQNKLVGRKRVAVMWAIIIGAIGTLVLGIAGIVASHGNRSFSIWLCYLAFCIYGFLIFKTWNDSGRSSVSEPTPAPTSTPAPMSDEHNVFNVHNPTNSFIGINKDGGTVIFKTPGRSITPENRASAVAEPRSKEHRLAPIIVRFGGKPPEEHEFGMSVCQLLRECDFLVQEACSPLGVDFTITGRPPLTGTVLKVYRDETIDAVVADLRTVLEAARIKYEVIEAGTFAPPAASIPSRWADPPITLIVVNNPLEYEKK